MGFETFSMMYKCQNRPLKIHVSQMAQGQMGAVAENKPCLIFSDLKDEKGTFRSRLNPEGEELL